MPYRLTFFHRMYVWTISWASHPYAGWALFGIAFIESSVFLIPPDVLLIPMVLAVPSKWVRYALLTTAGSVLGGVLGYYIGFGLWESIGQAVVSIYGLEETLSQIQMQYEAHAFLTIFGAAFTPIPYKVITIASGLFQTPFFEFIIASFLGRGFRFFILGALIGIFGERMKILIEKYFDILAIVFFILFVGGFVVIRWII